VGRNRVELWGRIVGKPELRVTPAGTPVLRMMIDCAEQPGELGLTVVMTGEGASAAGAGLESGTPVNVIGSLRALRRQHKSGLIETAYEVAADSIVRDTID
jgi:single-stranded DNA-binding protein